MATYKKCAKCKKWTDTGFLELFIGIGLICNSCRNKILDGDE